MNSKKDLSKVQLYSSEYKKFINKLLKFSKNENSVNQSEESLEMSLSEVAPLLSIRFKLGSIIRNAYHLSADHHHREVFDYLFDNLQEIIPFDRMAIALVNNGILSAHWIRSKYEIKNLNYDYSAPIEGSSLETLLQTGTPRIVSDLREYKRLKPQSKSTELALKEGILSNLSFPLINSKGSLGVIFFSSNKPDVYVEEHIQIFQEIADDFTVLLTQGKVREQQHDNLTKDKMLSIVVHDLRTPVGVMMGFLDLLFEESWYKNLAEKEKEIFLILKRNAFGMLGLINELSDIKKISYGHMEIEDQEVVVWKYLKEAFRSAQILGQPKNIKVKGNISETIPELLYFDPNRIRQVLDNLISNAIKFSNPKTLVTINVYTAGERLYFSIVDQGPGIPPDEQEKLFTEFGKTSVKPTAGEYSTGLGLVIVKRIIESCGGSIIARSEVGKGSEFTFFIPLKTEFL